MSVSESDIVFADSRMETSTPSHGKGSYIVYDSGGGVFFGGFSFLSSGFIIHSLNVRQIGCFMIQYLFVERMDCC